MALELIANWVGLEAAAKFLDGLLVIGVIALVSWMVCTLMGKHH